MSRFDAFVDDPAYTYLVDALGRRIGKKEKIGTGADTLKKRWLYRDSLNPIAELNPAGDLAARYVYGSRPNVPDLVIKGTKTYRLITDQLGSPRMAVNIADSTDVPYRVDYSAFGAPTWKGTGAAATPAFDWIPFGFAGGLYDSDTGFIRFGARDYDPGLGRWVSRDPIRFDGRQANLYSYANGDPVNYVDRMGRATTMPMPVPSPWGPVLGGGLLGGVVAGLPGALIGAILGAAISSVPGDTPLDEGCGPNDRPWPSDAPPRPKRDCYAHAALVYEGCIEDRLADPDTCAEVANYALLKCLAESGSN